MNNNIYNSKITNSNSNSDSDSDSDSDSNSYNNEFEYKITDISKTKYNLVFCELDNYLLNEQPWYPKNTNQTLYYHYILILRFKKLLDIKDLESYMRCYGMGYEFEDDFSKLSPIRNFEIIVTNEWYIKPEIAQCILLNSGHTICILKTFWLKIIQRKWKNIFKQRKNNINVGLKGMLSNIKY